MPTLADCQCVSCLDCNGMGFLSVDDIDYPEDDVEACSRCHGSGIVEKCERCCDLEDRNSNWSGH